LTPCVIARALLVFRYGVAMISRLLKIMGLFCRISSLLYCVHIQIYKFIREFVFYVDTMFDTMCYGSGIAGIYVDICIFVSTVYCVCIQIYKFIHEFVYFCVFGVSHHVLRLGYCWYLCIYMYICIHCVLRMYTNIQIDTSVRVYLHFLIHRILSWYACICTHTIFLYIFV